MPNRLSFEKSIPHKKGITTNSIDSRTKMASIAIMRNYVADIVNFSAETARTIINQGLDDFTTLSDFTKDDMKTLYTAVCCPGGMIVNPRASLADQSPAICDPGHLISMVVENCLIMTVYAAMHNDHTSRPTNSRSMTREFFMSLVPLCEQELAYISPPASDKPLTTTSMSKWLESLDDYLRKVRGVNKCPLAYISREDVAVKPHEKIRPRHIKTSMRK